VISVIPGKGRGAACDPESSVFFAHWMPASAGMTIVNCDTNL
jgi:hypothetical protein